MYAYVWGNDSMWLGLMETQDGVGAAELRLDRLASEAAVREAGLCWLSSGKFRSEAFCVPNLESPD